MPDSVRPRDRWLLPVLESFLPPGALTAVCAAARDSYWTAAVGLGVCTDAELLDLLEERLRVRAADLAATSPEARDLLPEALARQHRVLPLSATAATLDVATSDPGDLDAERAIGFAAGRRVRFRLAPPSAIAARLDAVYQPGGAVGDMVDRFEARAGNDGPFGGERGDGAHPAPGQEQPMVRLVDLLIAEGIAARASDVHLEPEEDGIAVRYRIDGVLRPARTLPRAVGLPLVSRVKIMAGMDIADRLRPQDGRARADVEGAAVDLRVSTLPAAHGEKVVIRILDRRATLLSLDALGLPPADAVRLGALLDVREGLVLVTGPTGSGKTTTLYSALERTQSRGVNVVTVEDPVEYRVAGAVQVQINEKAGLTFASVLRSILRQDPDVVLVGEIRDRETAAIAVQAALTGHLVLSTLHTNDAAGAVTRLLDLGVDGVKLAGALKGVVAQRLLRRLCRSCRAPRPATAARPAWLPAAATSHEGRGCARCAGTGYRGRMAIAEVLVVRERVARAIVAGESAEQIAACAEREGMRSLWTAGVERAVAGETTPDEVARVLGGPPAAEGRVTGSLDELRTLLATAGYALAPQQLAGAAAVGESGRDADAGAALIIVRQGDGGDVAGGRAAAGGLRPTGYPATLPPRGVPPARDATLP